jgi:hypothetical protein
LSGRGLGIGFRRARAGAYSRARYRKGLKAYRRRLRPRLLAAVTPLVVGGLAVALTRKLDTWSFVAGTLLATAVAVFMFIRDEPPPHVTNQRLGAEGERRTERALKPLERKGWNIDHDVQRDGRANFDHVVSGPRGVFLLETKNLAGTITIENGVLTTRQFDDPESVFQNRYLAGRVIKGAVEISAQRGAANGRRPWVTPVVVIWGHFPERHVEAAGVTYISGELLRGWLETRRS